MKIRAPLFGLRHTADLRALGFLLVQTLLMAGLWTGTFHNIFAWYAVAWLAVIAANVKHNHMHRRIFRRALPNLLLDHWLGLMTGKTATSILTDHNIRHHGHPNGDDDLVRSSLVGYRSQWLNLLCFFPRVVWGLFVHKPFDFRVWWGANRALFWRGLGEQFTLWSTFSLLLMLNWQATLLYVALPWLHGLWWILTFNLVQHQDLANEDPWQNSRNVTGRWFNWFFFNSGFHTAHHLRPALHWSELPAFHTREVTPRIDNCLVAPTLWSFYYDWFTRRSLPIAAQP